MGNGNAGFAARSARTKHVGDLARG